MLAGVGHLDGPPGVLDLPLFLGGDLVEGRDKGLSARAERGDGGLSKKEGGEREREKDGEMGAVINNTMG